MPETAEVADESRCEVCDWPLADSPEKGCVKGNCSYRPEWHSAEWYRMQARRQQIALRQDRILTVPEVAAYLRVHPSTIYRMLKEKKIPAFKIGSEHRFMLSQIDKWRFEQK